MAFRIAARAALFAFLAFAVSAEEPVSLDTIHRIRAEAFENSKVMEHLYYLTEIHGPRLTNSPAIRGAGQWVVETVGKWGAKNAHLEKWGPFGRGWSYSQFSAALVEPQYAPLIGFPLAWTEATNGVVSGEMAFALIDEEKDFEKYKGKLKGKIVLLELPRKVALEFSPAARRWSQKELEEIADATIPDPKALADFPKKEPEHDREFQRKFRNARNRFLREEGAVLVLTPGLGSADSPSHRSQNGTVFGAAAGSWKPEDPVAPPAIALTPEHYDRLARLVAMKLPYKVAFRVDARFHDEDLDSFNVIAEIPGATKPGEIVMLGAHLDSWHGGTGATDNASGSSVTLEAFRILLALGLKMDRTVRLALWTGEEQGLLGSKAYVKEHFADPEVMHVTAEHAKLAGYFNLDNGSGKIRGVYLQGNDMVRPIFEQWLKPFHDLGARTLSTRDTGGTDHLSFDAVGLPGFQFIQEPLEYGTRTHHSNMDVYDKTSAKDLMQASAIMASFVYHAATRPEMLPREPLPKPKPKEKDEKGELPAPSH